MADADSNTSNSNPLIGLFPEDTLSACCSVLAYLQNVTPIDVLTEQEVCGLANIHEAVKHALSSEIGRITAYRIAAKDSGVHHG